jgi:hypothetical protein
MVRNWTVETLGKVDISYIENPTERRYFPRDVFDKMNGLLNSNQNGFKIYCPWCQMKVPRFRVCRRGNISHHYEICSARIAEKDKKFLERRLLLET